MWYYYYHIINKMLKRFILGFAFMAISVHGADHDENRNCSRVEFCNELRGVTPGDADRYTIDLNDIDVRDGTVRAPLTNGNNDNLELQIIGLTNDRFRLTIEEKESTRYKLTLVLDGEPEQVKLLYKFQDFTEVKIAENVLSENYVVIKKSPLEIAFYKNDILEVLVKGDTLIMQQRENSNPYSLTVAFPDAHQLYGIHEHADVLALRTTVGTTSDPYRLRNLDVAGYELDSPMSLYGSIPVLYGRSPSTTAGIFLHNAAQHWYDTNNSDSGASAQIMVESASLDLFILLGPTPKDMVRQYTNLTGRAHMPQQWALGYHQCRWNYDNQSDVKDVLANLDKHNFPVDVMWVDIEYTDAKKYFTWNPENFSDPIEMQQNISATGRKLVTIIDPHVKVDEDYSVYKGALEKDLFVKNPNGSNFEGDCWPGLSSYMDFLNPEARSYYAKQYHFENYPNTTETMAGIWNDMNEPSVFDDSIEKTLPGDVQHKDADGNIVLHRDIHNIYGLMNTMATHQGLLERENNTKRPFVLTRSHFAGSQRFAAFWTGDNTADWGYIRISYAECLNANMLGMVFCGADIGGFFDDPSEELLQRWYQAAAWTPFYRQHANMGTPRREPYLYSEDVQAVIRDAMNLRYKHLPVWYTLFFEHTVTGDPILRPLYYHYPADLNAMTIGDQLLVGSDIMVKPVYEPEATSVNVYFPDDAWYSINNQDFVVGPTSDNVSVDINAIPIYYRAGSAICRKDTVRKSTVDMVDDCYTLYANLDKDKQASGTVYVDDLTSFKYRDEDEYLYANVTYNDKSKRLTIEPNDERQKGEFEIIICKLVVNDGFNVRTGNGKYATREMDSLATGESLESVKISVGTKKTVLDLNFNKL